MAGSSGRLCCIRVIEGVSGFGMLCPCQKCRVR